MNIVERQPLPAGTVIEYCGERGEVLLDQGGDGRITVKVGGHEAWWRWTYEGVSCSVISQPSQMTQTSGE